MRTPQRKLSNCVSSVKAGCQFTLYPSQNLRRLFDLLCSFFSVFYDLYLEQSVLVYVESVFLLFLWELKYKTPLGAEEILILAVWRGSSEFRLQCWLWRQMSYVGLIFEMFNGTKRCISPTTIYITRGYYKAENKFKFFKGCQKRPGLASE